MRIAILIYSLSSGGAERVASYLIEYFCDLGYEVNLFLMNDRISYPLHKEIKIHYLEKSNPKENGILKLLKIPRLAYLYSKQCKAMEISHSLSLMTRPNYINIISRFFGNKSKIIINERAFPSLQYGYPTLQSFINKRLIKILFPQADLILGNSRGNVQDLKENFGIPESKLMVINNPINLSKVKSSMPIKGFYDSDFLNLITIGRLEIGKNHKMLIDAISEIPFARLYIIGDGILNDELVSYVKKINLAERVFFLGFQNDPFKYIKAADVFVFGSNHEGFPNVLLEAMACEIPIVSTNCKAGPSEIMEVEEEFSDNIMSSEYGFLVPVNNSELMREAILKLFASLKKNTVLKNSLRNRSNDFNLSKIMDKYSQIIQ